MCQLLGLSSNKEADIQFSLKEFKKRGRKNPHGWGFAFERKGIWELHKKPKDLSKENIKSGKFLYTSRIIIAHIRLSSCGSKTHENTHPFNIDKWAFAHNGTVTGIMGNNSFRLSHYWPKGKTDSEYAFCYLLGKFEEDADNIIDILLREAEKIKRFGHFNFLLSDGQTLYAYGDNSLYHVQRKFPFSKVTLIDDGYNVDLNEIKRSDEEAFLLATEPLTHGENWKKFQGLKIFRDGKEEST